MSMLYLLRMRWVLSQPPSAPSKVLTADTPKNKKSCPPPVLVEIGGGGLGMYRDAIQFHGLFIESVSQSESSEVLSFYSAPPPLVQAAAAASTVRCCPNPHREERTERLGPPVTGTPTPPPPYSARLGICLAHPHLQLQIPLPTPQHHRSTQQSRAEKSRTEPKPKQSKPRAASGRNPRRKGSQRKQRKAHATFQSPPNSLAFRSLLPFPHTSSSSSASLPRPPHPSPPPLSLSSPAAIALPHCAGSYQSSAGPCRRRA